jgi:hypothetical protein
VFKVVSSFYAVTEQAIMMTREQATPPQYLSVLQNVKGFEDVDNDNGCQSYLSQLSKMVKKGQSDEEPEPSKG